MHSRFFCPSLPRVGYFCSTFHLKVFKGHSLFGSRQLLLLPIDEQALVGERGFAQGFRSAFDDHCQYWKFHKNFLCEILKQYIYLQNFGRLKFTSGFSFKSNVKDLVNWYQANMKTNVDLKNSATVDLYEKQCWA